MKPVWGLPGVDELVSEITREGDNYGPHQSLGVIDGNGRLIAGVIFHGWQPEYGVIQVTAASLSRKWATRTVLRAGFGYAFSFCRMVIARTSENNTPVRRLWRAFGAQEVLLPDLRAEGEGEAVMMLSKDSWERSRFEVRNGKK